LLEKKKIPKEILKSLVLVKTKLLTKEYSEAEQAYFTLTIGNATWGRANSILENDAKRVILQAIKRIMTFWMTKMLPKFVTVEQKEDVKERNQSNQSVLERQSIIVP